MISKAVKSEQNSESDEKKIPLDLIRSAAAGNADSFSRIVERFSPLLNSLISDFSVPESERDDLFQEGLIGLYKAVCLYRPEEASFSTFAVICMKTSILSSLRRSSRRAISSAQEIEVEEIASAVSDPEGVLLEQHAMEERLVDMGKSLSKTEHRVLLLHLQGKRTSEIASLLKSEQKSVENALARARKKLREKWR